jgi:hypothetical protein
MGKYKLNPTTSELDMVGGDAQGAPAAHKTTHSTGGTDALSPADIGAAATGHGHAISDVSGLQTALDGKASTSSIPTPGGSNGCLTFNDGGTFGGDVDLTYNKTTNLLTSKGDILLDDGGSFTTTLQTVTATANRTISFPDATGTVALVGGSSGQVLVNTNGAVGGLSTLTADGSGNLTLSARLINAFNAAASAPAKLFSGTWFTGGTSTTTKPHLLIEPAGTTSNNFSTAGTGFAVNGPAGFGGDLAWFGVGGQSRITLNSAGTVGCVSLIATTGAFVNLQNNGGGYQINSNGRINLNAIGSLCWALDVFNGNPDLIVLRDAANTLAQRNGTNAQTVRIYNTFTSATNFERAKVEWVSNILRVGTEKGTAGGTARDMELQTDGTTRITVKADGAILFSNIPTTNPNVAGQLWSDANDGGTLKLSAG